MTALLMVRAEVADADRDAFEQWYETEHLPQAKAAFQASAAWRGWSDIGVHVAVYEFEDLATAHKLTASDALATMVAEFDRVWQDRVHRKREIVEVRQAI